MIEPQSGEIRYVGQTRDTIEHRLYKHKYEGATSSGTSHRTCWLRKQMRTGFPPEAEVIAEVDIDHLNDAEIYWIQHFRDRGCNLVNHHKGGNGGWHGMLGKPSARLGVTLSDATRSQISSKLLGRKLSTETKERMRAARRRDRASITAKSKLAWQEGRAGNQWTTGKASNADVSCIRCKKICKGVAALKGHATKMNH